jgi:hypothetical protein
MTLARVPPKTEIVDVFSPDVPAYEGKACLSSACAADDTTTIAALLDGSQVASGWSADAADSSGGRNVSGLLRGVVLSA